ncbi:hypothetical protein WJX81_003805 [Elliptochloris bilobata]|uniref:Srp40 C-terminal domain-containing protein n=1 Tax=Elliptochloris bilobata TaxID=381761 RepID=A0AAW1RE31_9CHLO
MGGKRKEGGAAEAGDRKKAKKDKLSASADEVPFKVDEAVFSTAKPQKGKKRRGEASSPEGMAVPVAAEASLQPAVGNDVAEAGAGAKRPKKAKKKSKKRSAADTAEPNAAEAASGEEGSKKKRKKGGAVAAAAAAAAEPAATVVAATAEADGCGSGGEGGRSGGTGARAFQRVKAEEWLGHKAARDNSYQATFGSGGWGAGAQEVLGRVRGKDFRHEKTKKKRGTYRGGAIDNAVNSFKFDSDDEA